MIASVTSNNNSPQTNHFGINSAPIKILALSVGALAITALTLFISQRNATSRYLIDSDIAPENKKKIMAAMQQDGMIKKAVKKLQESKPNTIYSEREIEAFQDYPIQQLRSEIDKKRNELDERIQAKNNAWIIGIGVVESVIADARAHGEFRSAEMDLVRVQNKHNSIKAYLDAMQAYNQRASNISETFGLSTYDLENIERVDSASLPNRLGGLPISIQKQRQILSVIQWVEANGVVA